MGDVKLSVNTSYTTDRTDIVGNTIGEQERPLYWYVLNTAANIPLSTYKDWRNDLYSSPDGYFNAYYENPYWAIDTTMEQGLANPAFQKVIEVGQVDKVKNKNQLIGSSNQF